MTQTENTNDNGGSEERPALPDAILADLQGLIEDLQSPRALDAWVAANEEGEHDDAAGTSDAVVEVVEQPSTVSAVDHGRVSKQPAASVVPRFFDSEAALWRRWIGEAEPGHIPAARRRDQNETHVWSLWLQHAEQTEPTEAEAPPQSASSSPFSRHASAEHKPELIIDVRSPRPTQRVDAEPPPVPMPLVAAAGAAAAAPVLAFRPLDPTPQSVAVPAEAKRPELRVVPHDVPSAEPLVPSQDTEVFDEIAPGSGMATWVRYNWPFLVAGLFIVFGVVLIISVLSGA